MSKTDIRREMHFITKSGWIWVHWIVREMPDSWDDPGFYKVSAFLPASDGTTLFPTIDLFRSKEALFEAIEKNRRDMNFFPDTVLEVVEL